MAASFLELEAMAVVPDEAIYFFISNVVISNSSFVNIFKRAYCNLVGGVTDGYACIFFIVGFKCVHEAGEESYMRKDVAWQYASGDI